MSIHPVGVDEARSPFLSRGMAMQLQPLPRRPREEKSYWGKASPCDHNWGTLLTMRGRLAVVQHGQTPPPQQKREGKIVRPREMLNHEGAGRRGRAESAGSGEMIGRRPRGGGGTGRPGGTGRCMRFPGQWQGEPGRTGGVARCAIHHCSAKPLGEAAL